MNNPVNRRVTRSMLKHTSKHGQDDRVVPQPKTIPRQKVRPKQRPASSTTSSTSTRETPPIRNKRFGLIQESVAMNLYALLVAAVLWNRTRGAQARPVFQTLLSEYPTPEDLAEASQPALAELLRPIGLYNTRANRLIDFATAWVASPPSPHRRYRKLHYPNKGDGLDIGKSEVLGEDDKREAWEVAHLPALGPYAIDSFRIFHRDLMRGLAMDWNGLGAKPGFEPEWKRVVPLDKELKVCLQWMWLKEGWVWDPDTGSRVEASAARMEMERARSTSVSPGPHTTGRL